MATVLQSSNNFARLAGNKPNAPATKLMGYAGQQIEYIRQQQASSASYDGQIKTAAGNEKTGHSPSY